MIVPMKRVFLLVAAQDRDAALTALQSLGILHLTVSQAFEPEEVEAARTELDRIRQLKERLPREFAGQTATCHPDERFDLQRLWTLLDRRQRMREKLEALETESERIRPFGRFDPETIGQLADREVYVRFFEAPNEARPKVPGRATVVETHRNRDRVFFAVIDRERQPVQATEHSLPERSLTELERERQELLGSIEEINQSLAGFAGCQDQLQAEHDRALDRLRYVRARSAMSDQGPALCLQGFIPADSHQELRDQAEINGWGLHVREARPEESPPTLLRQPSWVRPIRTVFELIGVVPGYNETDISTPFLLFLSLFFAMIVGDAGYGALFLGGSLLARRLAWLPGQAFRLLLIMSLSTIVWGLLIGNVFGLSELPAPLAGLSIEWLTGPDSDNHLMLLCFIIGAVQLTLAHVWRALLLLPDLRAVSQLGWILVTWTMFFAARSLVLLEPFPEEMLWALSAGAVLVVAFMLPLRSALANWSEYVRLPLDFISSFVDLVSYIRLFAVGSATYAIAAAFNDMAAQLGPGGFLTGLAAAGIIFFGHSLNILLAGMGVLVHGVRLNTLEFAGHTGIQWTGVPFDPFSQARRWQR
jgi:V/A-type H+-transporting ATPase subunit I